MKRFLLIGGAGTIGYYFTRFLREEGYEPHVMSHGRYIAPNYYRGDIMYIDDIRRVIKTSSPDYIVHLAAEVSRRGAEANLAKTEAVNVLGTLNVGLAAVEAGVPVVYASTSEVYGRRFENETPVTEDMLPDPFNNVYGLSKYQGEQCLEYLAYRHGLKASIARIFMTYGEGKIPVTSTNIEGMYSGMAIMITGLLRGQPINVHRDTARQWCHVRDTCRGLLTIATKARGPFSVYNVGNSRVTLNLVLAQTIADIVGASDELIREVPCPVDTIPVKVASFEKIRRELGFEALVSLEDGLRGYIEWLRPYVEDNASVIIPRKADAKDEHSSY